MRTRILLAGLAIMAMESVASAGAPPGWPSGKAAATPEKVLGPGDINGGVAGFTIGKDAVKLPVASGTIKKNGEIYMVDLEFKDSKATSDITTVSTGKILRMSFGTMKPGPAMILITFAARNEGVLSLYKSTPPVEVAGVPKSKIKGNCTITVVKLDEKLVEGTATCPSGMVNFDDEASPAVTAVTFKATAL